MAPQFSLAHLTVLVCSPPQMVEIAARAGYDFVSFRPISLGTPNEPRYPLGQDRALFNQTKAALEATGLKLLDIEIARIHPGIDPEVYLPAFEAAAELGGNHVLTSAWNSPDRNFVLDSYIELCELAKPFGLTMDLEFVSFSSIRTLEDAVGIIGAAARDNGGLMIDTLYFRGPGCGLADLGKVPREWFHFAQISDGPAETPATDEGFIQIARGGRLYLGEGGIDVAAILAQMPQVPYSIELPNSKRFDELGAEEFARRCIDTARTYLAAHPVPSDATAAAG